MPPAGRTQEFPAQPLKEGDLKALQRRQDERFGVSAPIITEAEPAERFLARVGIALRYGSTRTLPLASLYSVLGGLAKDRSSLARCITLTNQLLGKGRGIEIHVLADRVTIVHRSLVPALYALVRRGRAVDDLGGLSSEARVALALLRANREVTAGEVRRRLGARFDARHDPAYAALGELARVMLVDRGPFEVPERGVPYLSTEGYPYHLFHEVHADLAAAARRYSPDQAAQTLLAGYLRGAVFARVPKLASMFERVCSPEELRGALQCLVEARKARFVGSGRNLVAVFLGEPARR